MNSILNYQSSEYDCGPVTLTNALRFLFTRQELSPDLLRGIFLYTLDTFNEHGECGKRGTSRASMSFISEWFNAYGNIRQFPIHSDYLRGKDVSPAADGAICSALSSGGVVIIRCLLDGDEHYVLLTGVEQDGIALFDPYETEAVYFEQESPSRDGIRIVMDEPRRCNRVVSETVLDSEEPIDYALGPLASREALIVLNTNASDGKQ
ncbi:MAG: peptidase C39 [Clostridia bacterium]|nr:peptidase C39 [Clostridia bacterium]